MLGLAASLRNNTAGGLGLNFVHSNGYAMNYGIRSLFIATYLKLQSLNDLGFSKTYVMLQIAEVVNSMKGLRDFCCISKCRRIGYCY